MPHSEVPQLFGHARASHSPPEGMFVGSWTAFHVLTFSKLWYCYPDPRAGQEEPFPRADNLLKLARSNQNAAHIGKETHRAVLRSLLTHSKVSSVQVVVVKVTQARLAASALSIVALPLLKPKSYATEAGSRAKGPLMRKSKKLLPPILESFTHCTSAR